MRRAFEYLLRNQDAWKKGGLVSKDHHVKRAVLFSLYGYFAVGPIEEVAKYDPNPVMFVYGANRSIKNQKGLG